MSRLSLVLLTALFTTSGVHAGTAQCCTTTISLLDDVDDAADCKTVDIEIFTVPASEAFDLDLADGATVNLNGDILFGNEYGDSPFMTQTLSERRALVSQSPTSASLVPRTPLRLMTTHTALRLATVTTRARGTGLHLPSWVDFSSISGYS